MINSEIFLDTLQAEGVVFFTGVPDSYLNGFCNYLLEHVSPDKHIIAANEGNAVGIAAGYYFSTNTIPLVYMQNSGMGNALNPLVSLADRHVYQVPLLLLIGWRGEPETSDHPQHTTQGRITTELLKTLHIPYIIAEDNDRLKEQTRWAVQTARENKTPVAIIGKKGVFANTRKSSKADSSYPLSREEAIEVILDTLPSDTIYTATTGRATRELYFLRERRKESHQYDFLNVGSMGHASSVALGMALANSNRRIVCLDGDSAALMHMGAFTMAGKIKIPNMLHIILNNGAHESVGGQPSAGHLIDFTEIARGCGYQTLNGPVTDSKELVNGLQTFETTDRAAFIDIRIHKGLNGILPPLNICHQDLICDLMAELQKQQNHIGVSKREDKLL